MLSTADGGHAQFPLDTGRSGSESHRLDLLQAMTPSSGNSSVMRKGQGGRRKTENRYKGKALQSCSPHSKRSHYFYNKKKKKKKWGVSLPFGNYDNFTKHSNALKKDCRALLLLSDNWGAPSPAQQHSFIFINLSVKIFWAVIAGSVQQRVHLLHAAETTARFEDRLPADSGESVINRFTRVTQQRDRHCCGPLMSLEVKNPSQDTIHPST